MKPSSTWANLKTLSRLSATKILWNANNYVDCSKQLDPGNRFTTYEIFPYHKLGGFAEKKFC